jgi:hypothetical protein
MNPNKVANNEHPYRGVFVFVRLHTSRTRLNMFENVRFVRV